MKILIVLMLVLIVSFTMAGCSTDESEAAGVEDDINPEHQQPTQEEMTLEVQLNNEGDE